MADSANAAPAAAQDPAEDATGDTPVARHRRRSVRTAMIIANLVVVLGAVAATWFLLGPGGSTTSSPRVTATSSEPQPWRWESSLGIEISVPDDWATNDAGCHMSDRPSVVRGLVASSLCLSREPPVKPIAEITTPDASLAFLQNQEIALPTEEIEIDGVAATMGEGLLPDGRFVSVVTVASRDVAVIVRGPSERLTRTIAESARLVGVDHLGCSTLRPNTPVSTGSPSAFVSSAPEAIGICYYGDDESGRLLASTELTGGSASQLAVALNAAPVGSNPDQPAEWCYQALDPVPDAILLAREADGSVTPIRATFSACAGRGLDNGARQAQVSKEIIALFMEPLNTGYLVSEDIPG